MANTPIYTLDLKFQGREQAIASFMIKHSSGVVLVESGPGSTVEELTSGLEQFGYSPKDVTHLLLSHIHLDHAGAAGWLAQHGAQVFVHPVGAPHMVNPEKLLASAGRIYGDLMKPLWGDFLAVPEKNLSVVEDGDEIVIGNLRFLAVDTPGHAEHHHAFLFEDILFSGDIGGVRMQGYQYLRLPMPPPEIHLGRWQHSVQKLKGLKIARIAPTHFGIFDDAQWHLDAIQTSLDAVESWLEIEMSSNPQLEVLRSDFVAFMEAQARSFGLSEESLRTFEIANPVGMSADGLFRYWKKFHTPQ